MYKILTVLLFLCAYCSAYSGGSGTIADPYRISSSEDLVVLSNNKAHFVKHFILTNNIEMSGSSFTGLESAWNQPFNGSFDGKGYVISNFTTSSPRDLLSFFGWIGNTGVVRRIGFENVNVSAVGTNFTGAIAGWSLGLIEQCYVTGLVSGTNLVGSICGGLSDSTGIIRDCYSNCTVTTASGPCGGIVAETMASASVINCYVAGAVVSPDWSAGVVARTDGTLISSGCFYNSELTSWSANGYGITFSGLLETSLYFDAGWDFASEMTNGSGQVWYILPGQMPQLCINNRQDKLFVLGPGRVYENDGAQFYSNLIDSSGTVIDVTSQSSWSIDAAGATIDTGGYVTTYDVLADETITIEASYQVFSDDCKAILEYRPTVMSIYIDSPLYIAEDSQTQISCKAILDSGEHIDVSSESDWWEDSPYSTINSVGLITTVDVLENKMVTVSAWYFEFSCSAEFTIVTAYSGGYGTEQDPYRMTKAGDFVVLAGKLIDYDKYFIVTNDIDLSGSGFTGIGTDWDVKFEGNIDGQGHILSGFNVVAVDTDLVSLLGVMGSNSVVRGLAMTGVNINSQGGGFAGSIASWCEGVIEECYSQGTINGKLQSGGICGGISGASAVIRNCISQCTVTTSEGSPGAITASINAGATIENSYSAMFSGNQPPLAYYTDETINESGCFYSSEAILWSPVGVGLTIDKFSQRDIFYDAGWDMIGGDGEQMWFISSNGYPELRIFNRSSSLNIIGYSEINEGDSIQLKCVQLLDDGDLADVTSSVSWSVEGEFAEINSDGFLTANNVLGDEGIVVNVFYNGFETSLEMTVKYTGQIVTLDIIGPDEIDQCSKAEYICHGTKDNGDMVDISSDVVWVIEPPYAEFDENSILTSFDVDADTEVVLTASYNGITAQKTITIYNRFSGGGNGLVDNPYQIDCVADLESVNNNPAACYILVEDINLSGQSYSSAVIAFDTLWDRVSGYAMFQGQPFTGTFDGNGYKIENLTINSGGRDYAGLFGFIGDGGVVENLILENVNIYGAGSYCGVVAGHAFYASIVNCKISNAELSASRYLGGVVGFTNNGFVSGCDVEAQITGGDEAGGVVGESWSQVSRCSFNGYITGSIIIGGVVGYNSSTMSDCYSKGSVYGFGRIGGLAGENWSLILNSFSIATVNGSNTAAPLVGVNEHNIESCFWNSQNYAYFEDGVGITNYQFANINTFIAFGWDIASQSYDGNRDIWEMGSQGHPVLVTNTTPFNEGDGSVENPYVITTAANLVSMGNEPSLSYELGSNINLDGMTFNGSVVAFFNGNFKGNGYSISSLTIDGGGSLGLFGMIGDGAYIDGIRLIESSITGNDDNVGVLAGRATNAIIRNCYVTGEVLCEQQVEDVGGLVGSLNDCRIISSYNAARVSGGINTGGVFGDASNTSVRLCYNIGHITGVTNTGGLAGMSWNSTFNECYNAGLVEGANVCGGFLGLSYDTVITNCYNQAQVSGTDIAGGFNGQSLLGMISKCYSCSSLICSGQVGGFTALAVETDIEDCFWNLDLAATTESDGGQGVDTVQMKMATTYLNAGWDMVGETANGLLDTWSLDEDSYPSLSTLDTLRQINIIGSVFVEEAGEIQLECMLVEQDGTLIDVTNRVQWSVASEYGQVSSSGLFTAGNVLADETVIVNASYEGLTDEFDIVVAYLPIIERIYITSPQQMNENATSQFECFRVWDNGEHVAITQQVQWSSDMAFATVDEFGVVTAGDVVIDSNAVVTAIYGNYSDDATVMVITPYYSGYGTEAQPYIIMTTSELLELEANSVDFDKYFSLGCDINLSGVAFDGLDTDWANPFTGTFDGNGFCIKNFSVESNNHNLSIFGWMNWRAVVRNIGVVDVNIVTTSGSFTGAIAGWNSGLIEQCYVTGFVSGVNLVGGICGGLSESSGAIRNCYTNCEVVAVSGPCGGLVGEALSSSSVANCYAAGTAISDWPGGVVAKADATVNISESFYDIENTLWCAGGLGVSSQEMASNTLFADAGWDMVGEAVNGTQDIWYFSGGLMSLRTNCKQQKLVIFGAESVEENGATQLNCYLITDEQNEDVSIFVEWDAGLFASITSTGLLTGGDVLEDKTTTVYCDYDNLTAAFNVDILYVPQVTQIYLSCPDQLDEFESSPLQCTAVQDNGVHIDVTSQITWDVDCPQASVSGVGEFYCGDVDIDTDVYVNAGYDELNTQAVITVFTPYYSGHGTELSPYQIATVDDLLELEATFSDYNKSFIMIADINMDGVVFDGLDSDWDYPFSGKFDGGGHIIKRWTISSSKDLVSLFGCLGSGSEVKRLGLEMVEIYSSGSFTAGIAGWCSGKIEQCYVSGFISGANIVGGIAGGLSTSNALVGNSYTNCVLNVPSEPCGGIVATILDYAVIEKCYANGYVNDTDWAGGVAANGGTGIEINNSFYNVDNVSWSVGGVGLTTSQISGSSFYINTGWDFADETVNGSDDLWRMVEGYRPRLNWEKIYDGDFNGDGIIDVNDFVELSQFWLSDDSISDIYPLGTGDGVVNINDYSLFVKQWNDSRL